MEMYKNNLKESYSVVLDVCGREGFELREQVSVGSEVLHLLASLNDPRMVENVLQKDSLESVFLKKS